MRLTWRTFPSFFWGQFLTGFCFHLVLPGVLLLLAGLVLGWIGRHFGLYYLVWNENPYKQFLTGFAVFLLAWESILVGYLLEAQRTPHADRFRLKRGGPAVAFLLGIVLSSLLILAIVAGVYFLVERVASQQRPSTEIRLPEMEWDYPFLGFPFAGGALLAIILAVYFTMLRWIGPAAKPLLGRLGETIFRNLTRIWLLGIRKPDDEDYFLHGVALISWVVAFVFFLAAGFMPWFSPILGICFLLHNAIAIYAFLAYFVPRLTPVILLFFLGLLWLGGIPHYKQHIPGLERFYDKPVLLADEKATPLPPDPPLLKADDIDFSARELGMHPAKMKRPVVVVCVSGGGLRSSAWTLAVLHQIDKRLKEEGILFPYHIRLFSGASGGMLGASCYVLSLPEPTSKTEPIAPQTLRDRLMEDSLSPIVHQMAYGDLWALFWPRSVGYDRGRALEQAWNENLEGLLDVPFTSLREGEKAGWRPSLVFSPMLVEDGRRLFISNLDLDEVVRNKTNVVPGVPDSPLSSGAFELFRLYPDRQTREEFKVVTAARMSASFPYVTPATPLPTIPRRRVIDAAFYDNYGVSLPAAWLMSDSTLPWLRKHASGVLLVQIRDGQYDPERRLKGVMEDTSRPLSRGLEELTSPPEGLFTAQDSGVVFRNDEQLEMLGRLLAHEVEEHPSGSNFFTTVTFEFSKKASLSWYLAPAEKKLLQDEAATGQEQSIQKMVEWWKSRPKDIPVK